MFGNQYFGNILREMFGDFTIFENPLILKTIFKNKLNRIDLL